MPKSQGWETITLNWTLPRVMMTGNHCMHKWLTVFLLQKYSICIFWAILRHFWARETRLHSEINQFQKLIFFIHDTRDYSKIKAQVNFIRGKNVQVDAIKLILGGHHVVLNIPTGGGKSFPQMAANIFGQGKLREKYVALMYILRYFIKVTGRSQFLCCHL